MVNYLDLESILQDCDTCETNNSCDGCSTLNRAIETTKQELNSILGNNLVINYILQALFEKNKENKNLQEKIEELEKCVFIDKLTGVGNRAAHDSYLEYITAQIDRGALSGCYYLFLDLNDFKGINDTFGHNIGDNVLTHVAQILKKEIRESDKIFRYGGDEFAIIALSNDNKGIKNFVKKIKTTILGSPYVDNDGKSYSVSISVGVAPFISGEEASTIHKKADNALYCCKKYKKCLNCYLSRDYCLLHMS